MSAAAPAADREFAAPLALLVGELNPYQAEEKARYTLFPYPEASAGGRLCRLVLGLRPGEYLAAYSRANLCSGQWSASTARRCAEALLRERAPKLPIVLLGAKVAAAFDLPYEPFTRRGRFVILPHPSGRCRAWNDSSAFERARAILREAGALRAAEQNPLTPQVTERALDITEKA